MRSPILTTCSGLESDNGGVRMNAVALINVKNQKSTLSVNKTTNRAALCRGFMAASPPRFERSAGNRATWRCHGIQSISLSGTGFQTAEERPIVPLSSSVSTALNDVKCIPADSPGRVRPQWPRRLNPFHQPYCCSRRFTCRRPRSIELPAVGWHRGSLRLWPQVCTSHSPCPYDLRPLAARDVGRLQYPPNGDQYGRNAPGTVPSPMSKEPTCNVSLADARK